jgi:hypothetical protein
MRCPRDDQTMTSKILSYSLVITAAYSCCTQHQPATHAPLEFWLTSDGRMQSSLTASNCGVKSCKSWLIIITDHITTHGWHGFVWKYGTP